VSRQVVGVTLLSTLFSARTRVVDSNCQMADPETSRGLMIVVSSFDWGDALNHPSLPAREVWAQQSSVADSVLLAQGLVALLVRGLSGNEPDAIASVGSQALSLSLSHHALTSARKNARDHSVHGHVCVCTLSWACYSLLVYFCVHAHNDAALDDFHI
jgi:hypothetical protein